MVFLLAARDREAESQMIAVSMPIKSDPSSRFRSICRYVESCYEIQIDYDR
jgi:hypothetical protein